MSQAALFHECVTDAVREVVMALGGIKATAARMRPEMPPDHAGRWLADCLSQERREKLSPDQVLWLSKEGRRAGCHALMVFMAREAGYADPTPIEPEDERSRLQREFVDASRHLARMAERIEALSGLARG